MDNYATHKTAAVKAWLAKHPRFKVHFIPTSSSWLNLVERFFAEITGKRIGVARSALWPSWKSRSTTICSTTTPPPSLTYGPKPPPTSLPKNAAPSKNSRRSNLATKRQTRNTLMSKVKHCGRNLSTSHFAMLRDLSLWIVQRRRRGPKTSVIKL